MPGVKWVENPYQAAQGAHLVVILTEWNEFRRPDLERMKKLMRGHVIFDGRNIYNPAVLKEKGEKPPDSDYPSYSLVFRAELKNGKKVEKKTTEKKERKGGC